MATFISAILSGLLVSTGAAIFSSYLLNKKERNLLIEKWIENLRNELSTYLGFAERIRLNSVENKFDLTDGAYNLIISSKHKIHLLLNEEVDQKKLRILTDELFDLTEKKRFNLYEAKEKEIFELTKKILDNKWKKINSQIQSDLVGFVKNIFR
jgi:hypothetical protein